METVGVHYQFTGDSKSLVSAISAGRRELEQLGKKAQQLSAEESKYTAEIKKNEDAIKRKNQKLEELKKKLDAAKQAGKDNTKETQSLEKNINTLTREIETSTKKCDDFAQKLADVKTAQANTAASVKEVEQSIKQNSKAYTENEEAAKKAANGTEAIRQGVTALKAAILSAAGTTLYSALIGSNAEFEQSMVSFEVLLQSAEKAEDMMERLTDFAASTPFQMGDLEAQTKLLLSYGVAEEDVMQRLQQLGDVSQGNAEKFSRVGMAYGQMVAKQKVSGEELLQMTEAGVPLLNALATAMGVTTAEVTNLVAKGQVGIPQLNAALEAMTSEGGQFFGMMEKQSQTLSGMFSTIEDEASIFARKVGEETFVELKEVVADVMAELDRLSASGQLDETARDIGASIAGIVEAGAKLLELLYNMRDVLVTGAKVWAAYKVAMVAANTISQAVTAYKTLASIIKTVNSAQQLGNILLGKEVVVRNSATGAITIMTAAQWAEEKQAQATAAAQSQLNAVVAVNPYALAAMAIIALVAALAAYANATEKAREKAVEAHQSTVNEIESVTSELDDVAEKINALQAKGPLTITEQAELQRLKDENDELNTRLSLLRAEEQIKAREANEKIENEYNRDFISYSYQTYGKVGDDAEGTTTMLVGNEEQIYQQKMQRLEALNKLKAEGVAIDQEEYDGLVAYATTWGKKYQDLADGYVVTDEKTAEFAQHLQDMADTAAHALDPASASLKRFQDTLAANEDLKNKLLALSKAGLLDEQVLTSQQQYKTLLEQSGLTAEQFIIEINAMAAATKDSGEAAESAGSQAAVLQYALDKLKAAYEAGDITAQEYEKQTAAVTASYMQQQATAVDLKSTQDVLADAIEKVTNSQSLSENEMQKLLQIYPQLKNFIYQTADGWTVEEGALNDVNTAVSNLSTAYSNAQTAMLAAVSSGALERLGILQSELEGINSLSEAYTMTLSSGQNRAAFLATGDATYMDDDGKKVMAAADAQLALNEALEKIKSMGVNAYAGSSGGGSSGGGSSGGGSSGGDKHKEAFEAELAELQYLRDKDQVSTAEYYNRLEALNNRYLNGQEQYLSDYRKYELEVYSGRKQLAEKAQQEAEKAQKAYKQELDDRYNNSIAYIEQRIEDNNWGADSEIAAWERVKAYMAEYFEEGKISWDEYSSYLEKINTKIVDNHQAALKKAITLSKNWFSDRMYGGDWAAYGDDPIAAWERVAAKGYSKEELAEFGSFVLDEYLSNAERWLSDQQLYGLIDEKGTAEAYGRVEDTVNSFYENGIISYREYTEALADIDRDRFALMQSYADKYYSAVDEYMDEQRQQVEDYYALLEEKEEQQDRDKQRAELEEQIRQYEGAVTKEGKDKLASLRDELADLEKEEAKLAREKEKQQALDELDTMEKTLKDQLTVAADITFDDEAVTKFTKNIEILGENSGQLFAEFFSKGLSANLVPDYSGLFAGGGISNVSTTNTTNNNTNYNVYPTINTGIELATMTGGFLR